jgi:hypothetical protein
MPIRAQATGGRVFPAPASGRPRVRPHRGGRRDNERRRACGRHGIPCRRSPALMPLSRRREAPYRVYGEDEFLNDDAGSIGAPVSIAPAHEQQRARRFAGLALLAGALGAVGGVLVAHGMSSTKDAGRKTRGRSHGPAWSQFAGGTSTAEVRLPSPSSPKPTRRRPRARRAPKLRRSPHDRPAPHAALAQVDSGDREARVRTSTRPSAVLSSRRSSVRHAEFGFER